KGAPRAHGTHRPGGAGLAHLVLQGRAEPDRLPARHRPTRAPESALLRGRDRHGGRRRAAPLGPEPARGPGTRRISSPRRRARRRTAAIRDDRKLSPRELEQVATSAEQMRSALAPLRKEQEKAAGAKKGAIAKHIHRIEDALLSGGEVHEEDEAIVGSVEAKN